MRLLRSCSLVWGWLLVGSVVGVASSRASTVWRARRQLTRRMTAGDDEGGDGVGVFEPRQRSSVRRHRWLRGRA